jgi:hypothetical protein
MRRTDLPRMSPILVLILLLPIAYWTYLPSPLSSAAPLSPFYGSLVFPVQSSLPPYAFDGAYANYTLTYFTPNGQYVYFSSYLVTNVDEKTQTFSVKSSYNSYLEPFGSLDNATFGQPIPFPAASPSQLQLFKEGRLPNVYSSDRVTSDVVIKILAGTFVTYELEAPVSTVWFDSVTGLLVQENGEVLGQGPVGLVGIVLTSTNIKPNTEDGGQLVISLTLVSVAAVVLYLFVGRRRVPQIQTVASAP